MSALFRDLQIYLETEAEVVDFGRALAGHLPLGTTLYLYGELGAGKTTLTRGIAWGLGHTGAVKSPTYTLVEPYGDLQKPLYHFDLYRLGDPEELEYMGIRDYFGGQSLVVVEWPERGGEFLPRADMEIRLAVKGQGRHVWVNAYSDIGVECLTAIRSVLGKSFESSVESGDAHN
ncbi:tRNA (adenosine(37)-N6)-threonylcarbamoyltransferase complex ATPase subunit type 1 TsaE [Congregibacter brevis]|uniref:tRNA threonylcarbamoyladenosine biosynthesis protein TsaE n=1 Tax=Congregibacter brevis TaxID=3081201 RepID=A0ABZ0ICK6_9GAMM|nr:tRNA (adenosine(37)-N6)-threonylcarbamoyltransferase complex ATPase subunit type 1 TsaE [Congregibacter sp. IMCC45268]